MPDLGTLEGQCQACLDDIEYAHASALRDLAILAELYRTMGD